MPADAFRPRTTSELLDASIQMLRTHYKSFLTLSIIGLLPQMVLSIYYDYSYSGSMFVPQYADSAALFALPFVVITLLWVTVADAAMVRMAASAYLGEAVEPRGSLLLAVRRAGSIVLSAIVKYLLIGVGYIVALIAALIAAALLLAVVWGIMAAVGHGFGSVDTPGFKLAAGLVVVPVIVLGVIWWVLFAAARMFGYRPAIMLEHCGADASLRRSNSLARGHVMKVVFAYLLVYIIYFAVYALLYAVAYVASARMVMAQVAGGTVILFTYPIIPIVTTLLYYDLRMRKEGYDIELMAGALEGREGQRAVSYEL